MGFALLFDEGAKPYDIQISADKKMSSHKIKVAPRVVKQYEKIVGKPLPDFFSHHLFAESRLSVTSFLGVMYSKEEVVPTSPGKCLVATTFIKSKINALPEFVLDASKKANLQILIEDKQICEKWAKTACVTGNWLPGEERIKAYCELLKEKGIG